MHVHRIRFNAATKEIEIEGPESFVEGNFDEIRERIAGKRDAARGKAAEAFEEGEERIIFVDTIDEPEALEAAETSEASRPPAVSLAAEPGIAEGIRETKAKRAPVRKYIRKDGTSIANVHPIDPVDPVKQGPKAISIASLKEKLGLSEQQIAIMIREAEKEGRMRKGADGSYVWV